MDASDSARLSSNSNVMLDLMALAHRVRAGEFGVAMKILQHEYWEQVWQPDRESDPGYMRNVQTIRQLSSRIPLVLWRNLGLGEISPLKFRDITSLTDEAANTAAAILDFAYQGCCLRHTDVPVGFWRTCHALTEYLTDERVSHSKKSDKEVTKRIVSIWFFALSGPFALTHRQFLQVRNISKWLATDIEFELKAPVHAQTGVAVADMQSDQPPMLQIRVPDNFEPKKSIFLDVQHALLTINERDKNLSEIPEGLADFFSNRQNTVVDMETQRSAMLSHLLQHWSHKSIRKYPRRMKNENANVFFGHEQVWRARLALQINDTSGAPTSLEGATAILLDESPDGCRLRIPPRHHEPKIGALVCVQQRGQKKAIIGAVHWYRRESAVVELGCRVYGTIERVMEIALPHSLDSLMAIVVAAHNEKFIVLPPLNTKRQEITELKVEDDIWIVGPQLHSHDQWQMHPILHINNN